MRPDASAPTWHAGLTSYLIMLAAAGLIPMILAALSMLWMGGTTMRDTSLSRLNSAVDFLSLTIEKEMGRDTALLTALPLLRRAGTNDTLLDHMEVSQLPDQKQPRFIHERLPSGGATANAHGDTPKGLPWALVNQSIAQRRPIVSNLLPAGQADKKMVMVVNASREASGEVEVVAVMIDVNQFADILLDHASVRQGLLAAVTDGEGRVIARSRDHARFVGKPVPDWEKLQKMGTDRGVFDARSTEGIPLVLAFHKVSGTPGWAAVVGEPRQVLDARWKHPLFGLAAGALAAILIALLSSAILARVILRPLKSLAEHSRAVAAGKRIPLSAEPTRIDEFETLRLAMLASEEALRTRAEAVEQIAQDLAASEKRYRTLAEAGALVIWRLTREGRLSFVGGWQGASDTHDNAVRAWTELIHPEDLPIFERAWADVEALDRPLDVEFRIKEVGHGWRWVRAKGARVPEGSGERCEWIGVLEDADAQRRAQARIAYMAHHDTLTGLGNRATFRDHLADVLDGGGNVGAVLYLDLDGFKVINDTLGHSVGDALLCEVANRLQGCLPSGDLIARLGGDEFVIALLGSSDPEPAATLAANLIDVVSAPYLVDSHTIAIGASIGVTMFGTQPVGEEVLLKQANMALYRAKELGRGRWCFFEPGMDQRVQERRKLELDLARALERGELEVHYQPLVDLRSARLTGFEALLRWNRPRVGMIRPEEFIPIAEDTGLIVAIGEWVVSQACEEALQWPDEMTVSVNVSPRQLGDPELADRLLRVLRKTGLPPSRLELEITENALLSDLHGALAALGALKDAGCGVVLDDFGTGHSSLNYLRAFPFTKIKIDRLFVQDIGYLRQGSAIVSAVTNLCRVLGLTSTAEGVETDEQLQFLQSEGCNQAQGYYFSRPCNVEQLHELLRRHQEQDGRLWRDIEDRDPLGGDSASQL